MRALRVTACCLFWGSTTLGQQRYVAPRSGGSWGPPPYAPGSYGHDPKAPEDPHARRHDGFYLRMGAGLGYALASTKGNALYGDVIEQIVVNYGGFGPALELLLGGTPARGFVVGGGVIGQSAWDPETAVDSRRNQYPEALPAFKIYDAFGVGLLGPFLDWFPDETGGAHAGAMIGLGYIGLERDRSVAGSLWGGYDFWVANQWSLGAELRAVAATGARDIYVPAGASRTIAQMDDTAASFQLLFTALYH